MAGQSLDEAIQKVLDEDVYEKLAVALLFVILAGWEWLRLYQPKPQPVLMSVLALGACGWTAFKLVKARRIVRRLRLARDGEREVAEVLEELREKGYKVLHDIKGDGFNVDHILVGPQGVFVVETKTASKPDKGNAKVHYDGGAVRVGGFKPDRDPVQQASALAQWIGDLVKQSAGRSYFVRAVVVYPGWYVENQARAASVWVLNPKMLAAYIEREPVRLGLEDVKLVSFHLARYVKAEVTE